MRRLLDVAPAPPALLVYQGDLGYAGNSRFSSYIEAPDFYFERFTRTLSDPHFVTLRHRGPVGFTGDDHDYCQQNNRPRRGSRPGLWRCGTTYTPTRQHSATTTSASETFTASRSTAAATPIPWNSEHARQDQARYHPARLAGVQARDDRRIAGGRVQRRHLRLAPESRLLPVRMARRIPPADDGVHGCSVARGARRHPERGRARAPHPPPPRPCRAAAGCRAFRSSSSSARASRLVPGSLPRPTTAPRPAAIGHASPRPGLIDIDPPGTPGRSVTLRAISGDRAGRTPLPHPSYSGTHPRRTARCSSNRPRRRRAS